MAEIINIKVSAKDKYDALKAALQKQYVAKKVPYEDWKNDFANAEAAGSLSDRMFDFVVERIFAGMRHFEICNCLSAQSVIIDLGDTFVPPAREDALRQRYFLERPMTEAELFEAAMFRGSFNIKVEQCGSAPTTATEKAHTASVAMPKDRFDHINELLDVEDFSELSDLERKRLGIEEDDAIFLFSAKFDDDTVIDLRAVSGQHNYYTTPSILHKGEKLVGGEDDVGFELSTQEVFSVGNEKYIINIEFE